MMKILTARVSDPEDISKMEKAIENFYDKNGLTPTMKFYTTGGFLIVIVPCNKEPS